MLEGCTSSVIFACRTAATAWSVGEQGERSPGAMLRERHFLPAPGDLLAPVVDDPPVHRRRRRARGIVDEKLRVILLAFVEDPPGQVADEPRLGARGRTKIG